MINTFMFNNIDMFSIGLLYTGGGADPPVFNIWMLNIAMLNMTAFSIIVFSTYVLSIGMINTVMFNNIAMLSTGLLNTGGAGAPLCSTSGC